MLNESFFLGPSFAKVVKNLQKRKLITLFGTSIGFYIADKIVGKC